jgi:D-arabinose 1-dehydrogenase-like Zn-dependent alcohol dehydrogenase
LTLYGVYMFTVDMTEKACRLIEDKGIKPAVGKVFEWEDAASAFVELSKGSLVGKIIIKVGGAE